MVRINSDVQLSKWQNWVDWKGLTIQLLVLIGCWLFMVGLHWSNDGLFFQGDSPRHAMNGIFWGDLIREGLSDPIGYTKSYYARYPAITPTRYPPVFYFFEALAFEVFGESTSVAKGVVQGFSLATGLYVLLAIRRWISPSCGIYAGLLFLMPGMLQWSNAVMLNIPAVAFATAGLYHVRSGIDQSDNKASLRQFRWGFLFISLAVGTHPTIGFVALIALVWIAMAGKLSVFLSKRSLIAIAALATLLVALFGILLLVSGEQVAQARIDFDNVRRPNQLLFYPRGLAKLVGVWGIWAGLAGLLVCLSTTRHRSEALRILMAGIVSYCILTPIWALDVRYVLVACPAFVYLIALGFDWIGSNLGLRLRPNLHEAIVFLGFLGLGGIGIDKGSEIGIRDCSPVERVVEYLEKVAPNEPVIYRGSYDGTFVYYLRHRDPLFDRQAILFPKLFESYNKAIEGGKKVGYRQALLDSRVRWLVVETKPGAPLKKDEGFMAAIAHPRFELVQSIPFDQGVKKQIDIYRIDSPLNSPEEQPPQSIPLAIKGQTWTPLERP